MSVLSPAGVLLAADATESGGGFWENAYPIIPHPFELVTGLIVFSVLVFLAAKFAVPRLEAMYAERRSQIEGGIERAAQAQAEADAALEEYREQLATARAEAGRMREEARAEGAQILAEMRERASAESARITESATRQVAAERQQAMTQLRQQVGGIASDLAGRIVGESLTDDARQSRVIDRFLDELERGETSVSGGAEDQRTTAGVGAPSGGGPRSASDPSAPDDDGGSVIGKVIGKVLGHDERDR